MQDAKLWEWRHSRNGDVCLVRGNRLVKQMINHTPSVEDGYERPTVAPVVHCIETTTSTRLRTSIALTPQSILTYLEAHPMSHMKYSVPAQ